MDTWHINGCRVINDTFCFVCSKINYKIKLATCYFIQLSTAVIAQLLCDKRWQICQKYWRKQGQLNCRGNCSVRFCCHRQQNLSVENNLISGTYWIWKPKPCPNISFNQPGWVFLLGHHFGKRTIVFFFFFLNTFSCSLLFWSRYVSGIT